MSVITLAAGCFWCVEAVFQNIIGVEKVSSGYANGQTLHPTYQEVCRGNTGYAEAVEIVYDPQKVSLENILAVFWEVHDPTTLNRQGADVGTQYRSAIFTSNDEQLKIVEQSKKEAQHHYKNKIVTVVEPLVTFIPAEEYHQRYYQTNPTQGYCQMVVRPKVLKSKEKFKSLQKENHDHH
jgi:methionine-S-sulfoxide reductase